MKKNSVQLSARDLKIIRMIYNDLFMLAIVKLKVGTGLSPEAKYWLGAVVKIDNQLS